jgi:hypothetical protein
MLAEMSHEWIFAIFSVYTFVAAVALTPLTVKDFKEYIQTLKQTAPEEPAVNIP